MKKLLTLSLSMIVALSAMSGRYIYADEPKVEIESTATSYEDFFKKDNVIDIKIEIADEDWQDMLANATKEEYKSANITVDGVTVENVGFRTKGNSSLTSVARSSSERYSFRVKFNKYVKGQKLLGLDELVLNNMYSDASYMREYLAYEAMAEIGLNATEMTFANIYVNGELVGLYLCLQAIEDTYLEQEFGSDKGNLYKADEGSTLVYSEGSNYDTLELKGGSDDEKVGLKNFIKILNEMPDGEKGDIESVLDVDSALKYIAGNVALGNYDSYNGSFAHNYYLYELDGKFTVIPWDLNMAFGGFMSGGTNVDINNPISGTTAAKTPLITNLLEVPEYKAKYEEYLKQYTENLSDFEERVNELAELITPYVEADPTKFYTLEEYQQNITYDPTVSIADSSRGGMRNISDEGFNMRGQNQAGDFSIENMQLPEGFEMPENFQMPDGIQIPDDMQLPEGFEIPQWNTEGQVIPDNIQFGNRFENRGDRTSDAAIDFGGFGGGGDAVMGGTSIGIINYLKATLESVNSQLQGETASTDSTASTEIKNQASSNAVQASPNKYKITVDGNEVAMAGYIINGNTYLKLVDISEAVGGFAISFENSIITLKTDSSKVKNLSSSSQTATTMQEASENKFKITLDGNEINLAGYNINGNTYFKLRDVFSAIGGLDVDFIDDVITITTQG